MIMLSLFLIQVSFSLKLEGDFKIELNPNCSEYFSLTGELDNVYLHRRSEHFELWFTRNESYIIYTHAWENNLIFQWPNLINGQEMNKALHEGEITAPFVFENENIFCEYYGLASGTFAVDPPLCQKLIYKCKSFWDNDSIQYAFFMLLIFLLSLTLAGAGFGNYESIKTVLRSTVPWILRRRTSIPSRSEETLPNYYQETSL